MGQRFHRILVAIYNGELGRLINAISDITNLDHTCPVVIVIFSPKINFLIYWSTEYGDDIFFQNSFEYVMKSKKYELWKPSKIFIGDIK